MHFLNPLIRSKDIFLTSAPMRSLSRVPYAEKSL